jgi:integrase
VPLIITAATISKAKVDARPGAGRYEIVDVRARGLVLRVSPTGAQWQLRYAVNGKDRRLALGSVDMWSIAEARDLVGRARAMLRDRVGIPDDDWLDRQRQREGKGEVVRQAETPAVPRQAFKWTFTQGRAEWLAEVQRTLSRKTHSDYQQKSGLFELGVLNDEPLPTITRRRVASIIADIHRSGRESTAEGAARVLSAMWTWLSDDAQVGKSGVQEGVMLKLRAPARTRRPTKRMVEDPTLEDLGRVVAIARSTAVNPLIGCAIELVVWTAQRRHAVAACKIEDFRELDDGERGLWYVYADDRKRSDGEAHVIPLPAPAWSSVQRALAIHQRAYHRKLDRGQAAVRPEYLFPQFRPRRRGMQVSHISDDTLTDNFGLLPEVQSTPHHVRHIFGTYGERILRFKRLETQMILDHSEGGLRTDVTGRHYALHDGSHEKWPVMQKWCAAVDADALRATLALEPVDEIRAAIAASRYGDDED